VSRSSCCTHWWTLAVPLALDSSKIHRLQPHCRLLAKEEGKAATVLCQAEEGLVVWVQSTSFTQTGATEVLSRGGALPLLSRKQMTGEQRTQVWRGRRRIGADLGGRWSGLWVLPNAG
jgi:hypothetical protein